MTNHIITHEEVKQLFNYDKNSGLFIWKNPPRATMHRGGIAGGLTGEGYIRINYKLKSYFAHNLAWFYINGVWPKKGYIIDHVNRNKKDNRIENLREITKSQNNFNRGKCPNRKSKYKGVNIEENRNRHFTARIVVDRKRIYLGSFFTEIEAAKAYDEAAIKYHKEYAVLNFPEIYINNETNCKKD